MISQETIEEIKEKVRLVELVAESVELRQRGQNYVGLCPFHSEKTPSFQVRDADNYYHCFGCGVSGNVITFVMESQGISFPEAVEYLAARCQIEVRREGVVRGSDQGDRKRRIYELNASAQRFFRRALENAEPAVVQYLAERGLTAEALAAFGVGCAPRSWNALTEKLRAERVSDEALLSAGLARRNAKGELYDSFRARLIFPVMVDARRIAGFGGRVIPALLDEDARASAPKYLNSQETAAYQKNKILYGLPQALPSIKGEKCLYLVEGYMDVLGLWQAGVRNVVATCGTAVTEQHAQRIAALVNKVFVVFDGDQAGRSAAARCFSVFLNSGVDASALFLPEGEDPDTIARSRGAGTASYLEELKTQALSLLDCCIMSLLRAHGARSAADLGAAAKAKVAEDVARTLGRVTSDIERSELIKQAAFRLIVDDGQLRELVEGAIKGETAAAVRELEREDPQEQPAAAAVRKPVHELPRLDQMLLHAVMARKESLTGAVLRKSDLCLSLDPCSRLFIEGLHEILHAEPCTEAQKKERIKTLLRSFGESWLAHWRRSYQMNEDRSVNMERLFDECLSALEREQLLATRKAVEQQIQQSRDDVEREELLRWMVELSRRLARPGPAPG